MIELVFEELPKELIKLIKRNKKGKDVIYCRAATDMKGNKKSRL